MTTEYTIKVNNQTYVVQISEGANVDAIAATSSAPAAAPSGDADPVSAPLAGNI